MVLYCNGEIFILKEIACKKNKMVAQKTRVVAQKTGVVAQKTGVVAPLLKLTTQASIQTSDTIWTTKIKCWLSIAHKLRSQY